MECHALRTNSPKSIIDGPQKVPTNTTKITNKFTGNFTKLIHLDHLHLEGQEED